MIDLLLKTGVIGIVNICSMILLCDSSLASETVGLGGVSSIYTETISTLWKDISKSKKLSDPAPAATLSLRCWVTPGNGTYVGIAQSMIIKAPMKGVEKVIDDVPSYVELFDDLLVAQVRDRKDRRFVIFSEQHIAVPFVANERDEMIYEKDTSHPGMVRLRYQLKTSNHLKFNDGITLITALSDSTTLYEEYDFWDADWGIAKTFGSDRIWKDSVKGISQADLAIKIKAENPGWTNEKVKEESLRLKEKLPIDSCVQQRKPFTALQ